MRILFLDLDTLRPDHLGCYGYHRNTSPTIDAIARQGVRFDHYHCSDAPCLPSRAALTTGRFGIHNGVVGHGGTAADMCLEGSPREFTDGLVQDSLGAVLQRAGLHTVSVSPFAPRHSAWWFYAGYDEMHNTGKYGLESAEEMSPTALRWIEQNAEGDNWFLHINYWDPHTPYRVPDSFGNPFKDDPIPDWITPEILEQQRAQAGPHGPREISMFNNKQWPNYPKQPPELKDMQDMRKLFDGYDCGIRYMDSHLDQLFQALAAKGVMDDLAIIISSDHGENMGELGIYAEHGTADEITTRIPMIIRWPGIAGGQVDSGFHYNLDLVPTLAELLNVEASPRWDGKSYVPALHGEECGREELVVSQCAHSCQRSVRFGPWLYMRTYHDFYHLFPAEMLFNLEDDPYEEHDVAAQYPEVCRDGAYRLLNWHDEMMSTMPEGCTVDPMRTVLDQGGPYHSRGHLKEYIEYLEKTGRGDSVPALKARHPREFV